MLRPFSTTPTPTFPQVRKCLQHRYTAGGTLGGPIIKNKLFGFLSYQHIHNSDQEIGSSRVAVPPGLTNDRSPAALAALVNGNFPSSAAVLPTVGTAPGDINPIAFGLLNYKLPNGQYLIPSAGSFTPTINFPENTFTSGHRLFHADQAVSDLDCIVNSKDTLALKYYYQHDPSIAPYAYSGSPGFTQHLDAGSQVASITNTQTLKPNLSVAEVFGFIREKVYSTISQPFTPQQFSTYVQNLTGLPASQATINTFGSTFFPGISIVDDYGNAAPYNVNFVPNAGYQYRQRRQFPKRFHRRLPEPLHALGQRHLDLGQAHAHLRRKLLLHAAQHARRTHRQGHHRFRRFLAVFAGPGNLL